MHLFLEIINNRARIDYDINKYIPALFCNEFYFYEHIVRK